MPETAEASPSSAAASFASLLAGLAATAPKATNAWNDDCLADDIATLSYEQALRAHAHYRGANSGRASSLEEGDAGQRVREPVHSSPKSAQRSKLSSSPARNRFGEATGQSVRQPAARNESRKSASITIRLSQAECAQLRERAAAAGLTVSAYLRSCTFEVETLRAQVMDALAQFKSAGSTAQEAPAKPTASSSPTWRTRLFPRWAGQRRGALD
jgi:mobilization protein NikA